MKLDLFSKLGAEHEAGTNDIDKMSDHELLVTMVKNQKREKQHQLVTLIIAGIFTLAIVITLCIILPKTYITLEKADALIATVEDAVADAKVSLEDFNKMADSVTGTINDNAENIQEGITKVSSIDIDSLNKAIKDLSDIVDPLARLFGGKK